MPTNPTPVSQPLAYPDRGTPKATFTPIANEFNRYLSEDFVPEVNQLASDTYSNAVEAAQAGTTATEQAAIATAAAETATANCG